MVKLLIISGFIFSATPHVFNSPLLTQGLADQFNVQQNREKSAEKLMREVSSDVTHVPPEKSTYFKVLNEQIYYLKNINTITMHPTWILIGRLGEELSFFPYGKYPCNSEFKCQVFSQPGDNLYNCFSDLKLYNTVYTPGSGMYRVEKSQLCRYNTRYGFSPDWFPGDIQIGF